MKNQRRIDILMAGEDLDYRDLRGKLRLEVVELPPWTPGDQHVRSTDQAPPG